jgi:hypothetical protein
LPIRQPRTDNSQIKNPKWHQFLSYYFITFFSPLDQEFLLTKKIFLSTVKVNLLGNDAGQVRLASKDAFFAGRLCHYKFFFGKKLLQGLSASSDLDF